MLYSRFELERLVFKNKIQSNATFGYRYSREKGIEAIVFIWKQLNNSLDACESEFYLFLYILHNVVRYIKTIIFQITRKTLILLIQFKKIHDVDPTCVIGECQMSTTIGSCWD